LHLHQLHVLGVLPPLFPLWGVVGSDGDVADWSVEPHVKHLRRGERVRKKIERG